MTRQEFDAEMQYWFGLPGDIRRLDAELDAVRQQIAAVWEDIRDERLHSVGVARLGDVYGAAGESSTERLAGVLLQRLRPNEAQQREIDALRDERATLRNARRVAQQCHVRFVALLERMRVVRPLDADILLLRFGDERLIYEALGERLLRDESTIREHVDRLVRDMPAYLDALRDGRLPIVAETPRKVPAAHPGIGGQEGLPWL